MTTALLVGQASLRLVTHLGVKPMFKRVVAGLLVALLSGVLPATTSAAIEYYHLDAPGSVRAVTDVTGTVIERRDYLPFGEECTTSPCASNPGVSGGQARRFTGKERDPENGLDYFEARYYSSSTGRFTTQDPIYTWKDNLGDPQRWNRYAYVRNSPLGHVDPDGRVFWGVALALAAFYLLNNAGHTNVTQGPSSSAIVPNSIGTAVIIAVSAAPALTTEAQMFGGGCLASPACQNGVRGIAEGLSGAAPGALGAGAFTDAVSRGTLVLGHGPEYLEKAAELGARGINIAPSVWNRMSSDQKRAVLQESLDAAIARGDRIVLATKESAARAGSWFQWEIEYLKSKGFRPSPDGMSMVSAN